MSLVLGAPEVWMAYRTCTPAVITLRADTTKGMGAGATADSGGAPASISTARKASRRTGLLSEALKDEWEVSGCWCGVGGGVVDGYVKERTSTT